MTTRTFKQLGQAYGSTQASIVATIDGVQVYSGNVNTVDQPVPSLPNLEDNFGVELFTWNNTVAFSGTQNLSITVSGSDLLLTDTIANYIPTDDPANPGNVVSGGSTVFGMFFSENISNVIYSDPLSNETIDGVAQSVSPSEALPGQWYWLIPDGSTFTATVNIQAGLE